MDMEPVGHAADRLVVSSIPGTNLAAHGPRRRGPADLAFRSAGRGFVLFIVFFSSWNLFIHSGRKTTVKVELLHQVPDALVAEGTAGRS